MFRLIRIVEATMRGSILTTAILHVWKKLGYLLHILWICTTSEKSELNHAFLKSRISPVEGSLFSELLMVALAHFNISAIEMGPDFSVMWYSDL